MFQFIQGIPAETVEEAAYEFRRARIRFTAADPQKTNQAFHLLDDFQKSPELYGGQPVALHGYLTKLQPLSAPNDADREAQWHEGFLKVWNEDRSVRFIAAALPKGLPTGEKLHEPATVIGYLFPMQATDAGSENSPQPLIVARWVRWYRPALDVSDFAKVKDRTLKIPDDEFESYYRTLLHAKLVDLAAQKQLAREFWRKRRKALKRPRPLFVDLFKTLSENPRIYRGQAVTMSGTLRKLTVSQADPLNSFGIQNVYEGWIFAEDSQSNPTVVVFTENPDNLPDKGNEVSIPVEVTGYVFKMYGYKAQDGKLRIAPMLLAKTVRKMNVPEPESFPMAWVWTGLGGLCLGIVLFLWSSHRGGQSVSSKTDRDRPNRANRPGSTICRWKRRTNEGGQGKTRRRGDREKGKPGEPSRVSGRVESSPGRSRGSARPKLKTENRKQKTGPHLGWATGLSFHYDEGRAFHSDRPTLIRRSQISPVIAPHDETVAEQSEDITPARKVDISPKRKRGNVSSLALRVSEEDSYQGNRLAPSDSSALAPQQSAEETEDEKTPTTGGKPAAEEPATDHPASGEEKPAGPAPVDELPEPIELTPEIIEDEALRNDVMLRLAVVLLAVLFACTQIGETTTLVHVKAGEYLAGHGVLPPRTDVFTYTAADQPWMNLSWLFDLFSAGVFAVGGAIALTVVKALIAGVTFYALLKAVKREVPSWWASICAGLALIVCAGQLTFEPQLITLLGLSLTLWIILHWQHSETPASLWCARAGVPSVVQHGSPRVFRAGRVDSARAGRGDRHVRPPQFPRR